MLVEKKPDAPKVELIIIIPSKKTMVLGSIASQAVLRLTTPKATIKPDPTIAIAARFIRKPGTYPNPKPR
jgi:hypothetical protein